MLRKFLSITVILSILCTFLSLNFGFIASAQEKLKEGYYTYTVTDGKATITACDKSISGDITVPEKLGGYPVILIDFAAFRDCINLTGIVVPEGIEIENNAFEGCRNLNSLSVPYICKHPGYYFVDSGRFEDDECVEEIGEKYVTNYARFLTNNLKTIKLLDKCEGIDDFGFLLCESLTTVSIGKNIKTIGEYAFWGCNNLQDVYYGDNEVEWNKIKISKNNNPLYNATIHYTYSETECDKHTYLSKDSERCGVCGKERSSEKAEKPTQNTNSTASKPNNTSSKNETESQENVNSQETESDTDSITQNEENTTGTIGATEPDNDENKAENTNTDNGEKDSNGWVWIIVAVFAIIIIGAVVLFLLYKKGIIFSKK